MKIQLTIAINRVPSKPGSDETGIMHTKSYNVEIMMGSQTDEIIEGLFRSLLQRYQERLECFQYALTVALNYKQIKSQPERISNIKPFFDQYNWKEIDFPLYKNQLPLYKNQNQLLSIFCMCHIILKK